MLGRAQRGGPAAWKVVGRQEVVACRGGGQNPTSLLPLRWLEDLMPCHARSRVPRPPRSARRRVSAASAREPRAGRAWERQAGWGRGGGRPPAHAAAWARSSSVVRPFSRPPAVHACAGTMHAGPALSFKGEPGR